MSQTGQGATAETADDAPGMSRRDDDRTHREMTQCNHSIVFDAPNANEKTFLPKTHILPRSNSRGGHLGSYII